MRRWTKPGGLVLVGEGYWAEPPTSEYLDLLGASADDYGSHEDVIGAGAALGLEPVYACVSSRIGLGPLRVDLLLEHRAVGKRERRTTPRGTRSWSSAGGSAVSGTCVGGHDALGFGLYLFRV